LASSRPYSPLGDRNPALFTLSGLSPAWHSEDSLSSFPQYAFFGRGGAFLSSVPHKMVVLPHGIWTAHLDLLRLLASPTSRKLLSSLPSVGQSHFEVVPSFALTLVLVSPPVSFFFSVLGAAFKSRPGHLTAVYAFYPWDGAVDCWKHVGVCGRGKGEYHPPAHCGRNPPRSTNLRRV